MKFSITIFLLIVSITVYAQERLSFDQALELTLKNKYDIQLARVSEEIAENSASRANNNYVPSINASGDYNWNYTEGENRLVNETRSFEPNNAYNYGASLTANYTLFNGQARKYSYLQSQENLKFTKLQLQQIIQNTVLELSISFHEVARLEDLVASLQKAVEISMDRKERTTYEYEYGQSNKLAVLNAKVDLNTDSISLITTIQELENQKRTLNFIMGQPIEQEFVVDNQVSIKENINEDEVVTTAIQKNLDLRMNLSNVAINNYLIKTEKSNWLPTLDANAGYLYNGSDNPNGPFVVGSRSFGPQAGLTFNWTLFNARNNVAIKNAKLNLKSSEIEKDALTQNIHSQALNAFAIYKNQLFVLDAQADNLKTAQNNFDRSKASFEMGQINSVEFRQAQLNLINTEQALSTAKYNAKNAELQLLAVMGVLIE